MRVPLPAAMMTTSIFDMHVIPSIYAIINQRLHLLPRLAKLTALGWLLSLSGCSLVVTGYNNAPNLLMFLWINPHVDLNAAQEKQTLADLKITLEWHRQNQLPLYVDTLKQMQELAKGDVSAEQVCAIADVMTDSLDPFSIRVFGQPSATRKCGLLYKFDRFMRLCSASKPAHPIHSF